VPVNGTSQPVKAEDTDRWTWSIVKITKALEAQSAVQCNRYHRDYQVLLPQCVDYVPSARPRSVIAL